MHKLEQRFQDDASVLRSDFGYFAWSTWRPKAMSAAAMGSGSFFDVSILGLWPDETSEEPSGLELSESARNRIYFRSGTSDLSGFGNGQSLAFAPTRRKRRKRN
jgi:hypothetical protein